MKNGFVFVKEMTGDQFVQMIKAFQDGDSHVSDYLTHKRFEGWEHWFESPYPEDSYEHRVTISISIPKTRYFWDRVKVLEANGFVFQGVGAA